MSILKKEWPVLLLLAGVFILAHIFGLSKPYHQDEYKWPIIVNPALTEPGGIPHPPVGEFIYTQAGFMVGYDNFRIVPFLFGFLNLILLFYLVKLVADKRAALWSAGFFVVSFYSLLASLTVDTDGAIMPFFFLLMAISYFKLKTRGFSLKDGNWWWLLLGVSAVLGFLVKVSFVIGIAALVLDFAIEKGVFSNKRKLGVYFIYVLVGIVALGLLLFISQFLFPSFRLEWTLNYWKGFVKFGGRGWMQTFIQFMKALLYLSPFLVLTPFLINKQNFRQTRVFFLFITIGLLFYLILFDFSAGALDRYFQFLIIPLCIIAGSVFAEGIKNIKISDCVSPVIISGIIFALQFFRHYVPALYPKGEWVGRILSLKWNFLYPFTGGSGPLGFYISFLFMGLFWVISVILILSYFKNHNLKNKVLLGLFVISIFYNGVFIEEYLFGKINGSSSKLVEAASLFIKNNPAIERVVVYNDNGGYEIQKIGKYTRRLYAVPQFEGTYRDFFKTFSGHVMYINIPRIGDHTFYGTYLNSCKEIYYKKDRQIVAKILECKI